MDRLSILKDEYAALRSEICQSIVQQHQILLSGYGASAAVMGFILGSSSIGPKGLFIVSIILLGMVSLWAVECNRMVRASYYIGYFLWPQICEGSTIPHSGSWEVWIRCNDGDFRRRQDLFQQVAVLYLPFLFSLATVSLAAWTAWGDNGWFYSIIIFGIISIPAWIYLLLEILKISNLGAITLAS
jgi:hypothetical protein